jgi:hypothetical protein
MDYKEIFDQINSLTKRFIVVRGTCDLVKTDNNKYVLKEFDDCTIYESTGNFDQDLMGESFTEEAEFEVECEGFYKFAALLTYSEAQIGNYPPPNVEVPAYYCLEHIEFILEMSIEEQERLPEIESSADGFCF